jgi:protoporphyrin/coproporphyrin ferrochelatase
MPSEKKPEAWKMSAGVILLNLGGPDSLQAVKPFLYNLFSDRQIIRLGPPFMQKPLALLISGIRSKKTRKYYSLIGGKSPIFDITQAQASALENALNQPQRDKQRLSASTHVFSVYIGMRYWHPLIENTVSRMHKDGIKTVVALNLYPHYSVATSGSSLAKLHEATADYDMEISCVPSWFNHPLYIDALVDIIKKGIGSFHKRLSDTSAATPSIKTSKEALDDIHVLFSAHSLPKKIIDSGDPYVDQIMGSIGEITKKIPIKWHLSYQSRSGPVQWLEPSTEEKITELAKAGVKNILAVPISFVSDHIETLYEIDILYKGIAENLGVTLIRADSLNTHPLFIEALRDIVLQTVKDKSVLH